MHRKIRGTELFAYFVFAVICSLVFGCTMHLQMVCGKDGVKAESTSEKQSAVAPNLNTAVSQNRADASGNSSAEVDRK